MTMANVIDISEYQDPAKFDYQAAKSNGIKAVIIRLSVGNRRDNHAAEHIANCKKYGLKWHGYHYWYNLSGEAAFAVSDAQSLGLTSSQYFFLDMEDKSLSSDWSVQFESFRSAVGSKYKIGLYCSDSPYKSHFDNAKMVSEGVYRWIAAYSYEPANYDIWQMSGEGSGGFGSYTGDVDRDYDKTGNLLKEETQPITPSTTPLYRQIIGEAGYDTNSGIYGLGRSYDNGKTFHVMDTVYGRIYRQQDGDSIWPFLKDKVKSVLDWSAITNKPDVALKSDLTWSNVTGKPDVALKSDVAAVSAVASTASAKATSNAATIASVSSTASSALSVANSNAKVLPNKLDKSDLTWSNVAGRPDVDKIASQASQAVVTANTAQSQASAAGQAASSASVQASAAKASANSALSKANNAQNTANSAQTSANNAQNTANSAQSTANTAIKVSETLKDLGNYTATASGTTANSPTTGLPRTSGVSMSEVYDNGYPTTFGNVLNVAGAGAGQLLLGWSGNDNTTEHLWYRSHRDTSTGGWGTWQKVAYVSDLTWSNISGKPDVATKADVSNVSTVANTAKSTADSALSKANSNATTLNSKVNKSDLTWANISGKPSIPSTFNGTITSTSTDFNSLVTEGHYDIRFSPSTQGKNGPKQGNWGLLDVKVAGRMIVQTYYSDQSNEVYVRNRHDGTWSGWRWVTFWPS